jgi:hypothetical protein
MKLQLPRPSPRRVLPLPLGVALDALHHLAGPDGIAPTPDELALGTGTLRLHLPPGQTREALAMLHARRLILLGSTHFAIASQLSRALKRERDRNHQRARHTATPADWTLHRRVLDLFPQLRGPLQRPSTYTIPAAFAPLLALHESHHKSACPADVEILTEACYAGELQTVLTLLEEQLSAHRQPVLLYTRKAVYVGVRRSPKR